LKNLSELIKMAITISQDRYDGDLQITKTEGMWKVAFRKKLPVGYSWIEVAEDAVLEKVLNKACEIEVAKAEDELGKAREFIKKIGSRG